MIFGTVYKSRIMTISHTLLKDWILANETGDCPCTAIREDISMNLLDGLDLRVTMFFVI
jgi:hypothetical protein